MNAAAASGLRFVPAPRWHRLSECERYAIAEANGLGVTPRYTAWRRGSSGASIPKALGTFNDLVDAEACCRRDAGEAS